MTNQFNQAPLVYLDQNVLSDLSKGKLPALQKLLRNKKLHLVYSNTHIEETARCKNAEFHSLVTNTLVEHRAAFLHQGAYYLDKSPVQQLEYCLSNQSDVYSQTTTSMRDFAHKFFGGQNGKDFSALTNNSHDAFAALMSHLSNSIAALNDDERNQIKIYLPFPDELPTLAKQQFQNSAASLLQTLNSAIPASESFNAKSEIRNIWNLKDGALNHIKPPQIVEQIWEKLIAGGCFPSNIKSPTNFLDKFANAMESEPTREAKISWLYSLLNMLGYWADEKLDRDSRFRSSLGDVRHAQEGVYAQLLVTCDMRMAKKTFAIYENLQIPTLVSLLQQDKGGDLTPLIGEEIFAD